MPSRGPGLLAGGRWTKTAKNAETGKEQLLDLQECLGLGLGQPILGQATQLPT